MRKLQSSRWPLPVTVGLFAWVLRIPFAFRYDLHFQSDFAVPYLSAKRMLDGEFALYFWNQEHYGTLLQLLTAGIFLLFGPSITLAGILTAAFWALAIGLSVVFITQIYDARTAACAGIAAAIGAPYFHHYSGLPSEAGYTLPIVMIPIFLLLMNVLLRNGFTVTLSIWVGLLFGLCWYLNKQILLIAVTIAVALILTPNGRSLFRQLVQPRIVSLLVVSFMVGYTPEWLYKLRRESKPSGTISLFSFASPALVMSNSYWTLRSLPAYFDGDPLARTPEGVHYLTRDENAQSMPSNVSDMPGVAAGVITLIAIVVYLVDACRQANAPRIALALYPIINIMFVILASVSHGSYYSVRRYLFTCALVLPIWLGIALAGAIRRRVRTLVGIVIVALGLSLFHQFRMLQLPDELRDYRAVVADMKARGEKCGLSWFSFSLVLTSLSNEQIVFGCIDRGGHSDYQDAIMRTSQFTLVYPAQVTGVPDRLQLFGREFRRAAAPRSHGELLATAYQAEPLAPKH
jgi:hypothetical protein